MCVLLRSRCAFQHEKRLDEERTEGFVAKKEGCVCEEKSKYVGLDREKRERGENFGSVEDYPPTPSQIGTAERRRV
jgi:hypothetical protein